MDKQHDQEIPIAQLRERISAIDQQVIHLLAQRMAISHEIGVVKKAGGIQIEDAEREHTLKEEHRRESEELGLDGTFISNLFNVIIAESKKKQDRGV